MGKKHFTPYELCMMAKNTAISKKSSYTAPYTTMSVLFNYLLFKNCNWQQKKLANYNELILKHEAEVDADPSKLKEWNGLLEKKLGFSVWHERWNPEDDCKGLKKGSFVYQLQYKISESDIRITQESTRCTIIHFYTMLEKKLTHKEITEIKDVANQLLSEMYLKDNCQIMNMHKVLLDEAGIYIELPK